MHPRLLELSEYIEAQHEVLRAAVEAVPPALRDRCPAQNRWSVAQVLDHLARAVRQSAKVLGKAISEARAQGINPERETTSVVDTRLRDCLLDRSTRIAAPAYVEPRGMSAREAFEALELAHANLHEVLRNADGLALGEVIQPHPVLGAMTVYQWLVFIGAHEARHAEQVREIGAALSIP